MISIEMQIEDLMLDDIKNPLIFLDAVFGVFHFMSMVCLAKFNILYKWDQSLLNYFQYLLYIFWIR
jgi:hypothetical protein